MNDAKVATEKEIEEHDRKCWNTDCKKIGWIENGMGWNYCIKHWRSNYLWGHERGLRFALKYSNFQLKKLIKYLFK